MMNTSDGGIDALIARLKTDAIDKAKMTSDEMIKSAKVKADEIIAKAREEARATIEEAEQQCKKLQKRFDVQSTLAARDFSLKMAERLREQFFFPVIKENLRATLKDPDFLKQVLERLIVEFATKGAKNLDVLLSKELKTTLGAYFAASVFDRLDQDSNIRLIDEEGMEGFVLIRRGQHYLWDFRVDTIAKEMSRLIEPSLKKYFVPPEKKSKREDAAVHAVM